MPKVFCIVSERDGKTTKQPGCITSALERQERRYAAETIDDIWAHIDYLRNDPEENIIAIYEEHPSIIVIKS